MATDDEKQALRDRITQAERQVRREERSPEIRGDQRMAYLMREQLAVMRRNLAEMEAETA